MKLFKKLVAHINIILGGMMLTFFIIDNINPAMEFIDNGITKCLIGLFAVTSITNGIIVLSGIPYRSKKKEKDKTGL